MALETVFRRFSLLPGFIQTGNGESRDKAHWLGNKPSAPSEQDRNQHGHDDRPPQPRDRRGYRALATITLGEVEQAYNSFRSQLVASPTEGWIARNYFCQ